jgi:hypothetical protein
MAERAGSVHAFANLDQQLVTCFETDQTRARVLDVKYYVYNDNRDHGETEDVKPTPVLANCHPIARQ